MKQWSILFSLLLLFGLAGCGGEQFGTVPKSTKESASPLTSYSHSSCSTFTLIKPKVDVLYVVDNSSSGKYYLNEHVKQSLSKTVDSLSQDFDFRVIGTPLLETALGNNDYEVMTNSSDLQGIPSDSKRIYSSGAFSFFSKTPASDVERGTARIISFIDFHKNNLIRRNSYLIIVLLSNGLDYDIEPVIGSNGETEFKSTVYNERKNAFTRLKQELNSTQLRLFALTGTRRLNPLTCPTGWRYSDKSYKAMANDLYLDSGATDNGVNKDSYNLCDMPIEKDSSGNNIITSVFDPINNSIKQVVLPHQYGHWPITFAENNEMVSTSEIRVHKIAPSGSSVELTRDSDWFYEGDSVRTVNTRVGPNPHPGPGEPVTGRHFIRFANPIVYPDCVLVTSVSRTEYFGYVVLPQKPRVETISLRINGRVIPQSSTNGWSDLTANPSTRNIKVPHPAAGDENPPVIRTGFMLQLNGSSNYYKSGDNVEVNFIPAGI